MAVTGIAACHFQTRKSALGLTRVERISANPSLWIDSLLVYPMCNSFNPRSGCQTVAWGGALVITQIFAVFFVPSGTADFSPAIHCWEPRWEGVRSARGTAETIGITNFQPSLRDWDDVLGRESQQ
jgi:hypothetical protein